MERCSSRQIFRTGTRTPWPFGLTHSITREARHRWRSSSPSTRVCTSFTRSNFAVQCTRIVSARWRKSHADGPQVARSRKPERASSPLDAPTSRIRSPSNGSRATPNVPTPRTPSGPASNGVTTSPMVSPKIGISAPFRSPLSLLFVPFYLYAGTQSLV